MLLIREVFQAKYGKAGELVQRMKQLDDPAMLEGVSSARILTDLTGPFDTVVIESVVASLDTYFGKMFEMFANADQAQQANPMAALVASGRREIYTIEAER
jgi:hypothetical protein